jgi:hypothetical protein
MESNIDFAFKGVNSNNNDLIPSIKDMVSDVYHEKMSDVSIQFATY